MPHLSKTWLKRGLIGAASSLLVAFGLIGFAHTKAGRPMLAWLRAAPGCPLSLAGGDPKTIEAFRVKQLEHNSGSLSARSHRALGFELGKTKRAQVYQWAAENAARCRSLRDNSVLQCNGALSRGAPSSSDYLAAGLLHRVSVGYRYRQYVAEISATNFGDRGIRVREQYQSSRPAL